MRQFERNIQRLEAQITNLSKQRQIAIGSVNTSRASEIKEEINNLRNEIKGDRANIQGILFEERVASIERPIERNIVVVCTNCGTVVPEFDMRLENNTILEAKSSASAVDVEQFANEQTYAQKIWGEVSVELAVPDENDVDKIISEKFRKQTTRPKVHKYK